MLDLNLIENYKKTLLDSLKNINEDLIEKEIGKVAQLNNSILIVSGLTKVFYNECVIISDKYKGYVASMKNNIIKVVLLEKTNSINIGDEVKRTRKRIEVPVSENFIGRILNGLGEPIDDKDQIKCYESLPVERPSKSVLDRKEVNKTLETGIKIIDCMIPIGKGQRELILGDRQTGKTSLAIDIILNQKNKNVICIYCAIGQRDSSIINTISILKKYEAMEYTIIISADASSTPGMQCIAPFSATSIAEYFADKGRDVLIIYDDLSKHAKSYREISLLLENTPGREAYPGDVFYLHSRLLERSINLSNELGGGSITSFPIIETEAENLSAYISTNVISITDGQIYLSPEKFQQGVLPAIDIGKSVSRIGSKAQVKAYKKFSGKIGIQYSQFEELELFSKFSSKLDDNSEKIIKKGEIIKQLLKQNRFNTKSIPEQVVIFLALENNVFDNIELNKIQLFEEKIIQKLNIDFSNIVKDINSNKILTDEQISTLMESFKQIVI